MTDSKHGGTSGSLPKNLYDDVKEVLEENIEGIANATKEELMLCIVGKKNPTKKGEYLLTRFKTYTIRSFFMYDPFESISVTGAPLKFYKVTDNEGNNMVIYEAELKKRFRKF